MVAGAGAPPKAERGVEMREYTRHNGNLHLAFQAGPTALQGTGIPYGVWPRRQMLHLATEAKRTGCPVIGLGESMEEYALMLGVQGGVGYGKRGVGTEIQRQAIRLFTGFLTTWADGDSFQFDSYKMAESGGIWWDLKHPGQKSLWRSEITLSARAFREMTERAIPLDKRALLDPTLQRSPLGLDLLVWLPYRCFTAKKHTLIPWWPLMRQFGAGYADDDQGMRSFRFKVRRVIKIILSYYPRLRVDASGTDGIWITPSTAKAIEGNSVD